MYDLPGRIDTQGDVRCLVDWCIAYLGLGYHPDTPAYDYIHIEDPSQEVFDPELQSKLDDLHEQAARFGDLIYSYGADRFYEILNGTDSPQPSTEPTPAQPNRI